MLDNTYAPAVVEVDPGEPIRFRNAGRVPHNVIADDGSFLSVDESGENTEPGDDWTLTIEWHGRHAGGR